jgi:hypothetical protein
VYHDFLILGGAGLVGLQVCRQIVANLSPRRIVVASLLESESQAACKRLEREFGDSVAFVPAWGNLFVPGDMANLSRGAILNDLGLRRSLLNAVYDDYDSAYANNHMVALIRRHRPEVIVDCVNTATGFSYQDVFDGAAKVRSWIGKEGGFDAKGVDDLETFLLSQSVPQLIRHVRFLHQATTEYATRVYVKVGTTGTGGMGLNIPYTHSEDKPSKKLLAKNEAAFGHTGLLFLLARTPNAPIVKEVKPAAMIGYRAVQVMEARDKHDNSDLYDAREVECSGELSLREDVKGYARSGRLRVPVVDTGENGVFTRGEFVAITALGQMEYVTPEEIAVTVVLEIRGANTGNDAISAMDGAVMTPSYKAGLVRSVAIRDLAVAEQEAGIPSVALGRLGPPELSKLLFEAELLRSAFGSLEAVAHAAPAELSARCEAAIEPSGTRRTAPSIGIPILLPDGKRLLRGPRINVPELVGHKSTVTLGDPVKVNAWADKGWIDLRPANMERWRKRCEKMLAARATLRDEGSAAASIKSFMATEFEIGELVAWIFNNEMGGYRVK